MNLLLGRTCQWPLRKSFSVTNLEEYNREEFFKLILSVESWP